MFHLKNIIIGKPLHNSSLVHEKLTKIKALAVYSSDALSSVAYATEEILWVLAPIGAFALSFSLPIAGLILLLLAALILSYRKTISAYPSGGGAYIVAKDNLGQIPGLVAGSSLVIDYILTVAVSIAAGVAAITSAFPNLLPHTVALCLFFVLVLMVVNLSIIERVRRATGKEMLIDKMLVFLENVYQRTAPKEMDLRGCESPDKVQIIELNFPDRNGK